VNAFSEAATTFRFPGLFEPSYPAPGVVVKLIYAILRNPASGLAYVTIAGNPGQRIEVREQRSERMKFFGKALAVVCPAKILATSLSLLAGVILVAAPASAQTPNGLTPDQIAEIAILAVGSRPVLNQIRRNGIERGRVSRIGPDGRSEDTRYEMRFVRGDKPEKDKVRIDNKTSRSEYSLIFGDGKIFGIINGSPFQPRAEATAEFISQQAHSLDALLRYKENESKLASAGKDKHQGIDVYVLDLTDKANRKTRYFVSAKSYRVLWLEYDDTPPGAATPVKYMKRFYDYRVAQNTWLPYRTILTEDGKQTVETRIFTVTYGVKIEDALFQNPEGASTTNP
jgi:outer membrane lipoprotein-sorting protein